MPTADETKDEVPEDSTETTEYPNESENDGIEVAQKDEVGEETTEAEQGFNPDLSNWATAPPKLKYKPNPPPQPEGKDYYLVYAWKWSNDERYAKVGRSSKNGFKNRLVTTYHPTDDPDVIGYRKCKSDEHAEDLQNHILDGLKRTRRDREWVEIDEAFEEMIHLSFTKGYPE